MSKMRIEVLNVDLRNNGDWLHDIPETPAAFMKYWQDKIDLIPDEYMETAEIHLSPEPYYDSASLQVYIFYERDETKGEK